MLEEKKIKNKEYWYQQFGLYPMLMKPNDSKNKFLMLNGGNNDFCLQTDNIDNERDARHIFFSESWSTNTKNFLVISNDKLYVYNWMNNKTDDYVLEKIEKNPSNFYNYLSLQSYKTSNDAVPYIISIFRELRNLTGKKEPVEALNLLFRLLISIEDDYTKINTSRWEITDSIVPSNFDHYVERIKRGVNSIFPDRDLILRHVSGILFQEAHKEVIYFDPQLDLFGGISDKIKVKEEFYSSVQYTPQYLARSIVENCLKQLDLKYKKSIKIFDPACGSSEFLIETLKQLKNANYQGKVKMIGWDTSSSAICTSKFLLKYEQLTQWGDTNLEFEIKQVADSLAEQWDNDYDLIVMNPPFVSWELLKNKDSRDAISEVLGSIIEGRPNQAAAFFYKATKSLEINGVLGCVLPYIIFTSDSYLKLRNGIKEELSLNLLAKLGNYVFESVLTDVSFFIGKKTTSPILPKLIWSKNEKEITSEALLNLRKMEAANQIAIDEKKYNIFTPSRFPIVSDSWKIISIKEEKFLNDVKRFVSDEQLTVVSDIFTVQQGIRQGKKDVFKIKKEEYKLYPKYEKEFFRPVVDNDAIKDGQLFDNRYIWYPYNQFGLIFKNEREMKNINFFNNKIKPFKSDLKKRAGIQEWWGHTRPRNWQFEKKMKLVSTEFGKSDSFAIDKNGKFVVERGYAWIPKKIFVIDDYYYYLSIFSSDIFDFLLSIYSKQLAGGNWYDLGAKYTKNIPIPNVFLQNERESERYFRLVELGKELENGNLFVKHAINDVAKTYYPNIW
jgi:type I restriction-modification system DNA methylase subunit